MARRDSSKYREREMHNAEKHMLNIDLTCVNKENQFPIPVNAYVCV